MGRENTMNGDDLDGPHSTLSQSSKEGGSPTKDMSTEESPKKDKKKKKGLKSSSFNKNIFYHMAKQEQMQIVEEVEKNVSEKMIDVAKRLGLPLYNLNKIISKKKGDQRAGKVYRKQLVRRAVCLMDTGERVQFKIDVL
uniref:Uncharacterized protein n=1 Tax=Timema poppense TaxID=170557 RepID=A0A7R9CJW1_TIMPO|nr:unnamed protein product [Timema poppensis]